jgi:hypothetical protein
MIIRLQKFISNYIVIVQCCGKGKIHASFFFNNLWITDKNSEAREYFGIFADQLCFEKI